MTDNPAIIHAVTVNGDGSGHELSGDEITQKVRADELAWVHFDATQPGTREWLESELKYLDNIIIDALLAQETRPRLLEFEEGVMLILRGVNLNENARAEDMISIRLWVDKSRIISVRLRKLKAVIDIKERLLAGNGPRDSGDFLAMLSGRLFERMEPVLTDLDEQLDDIEEIVMENPDNSQRQEITDVRKKAIMLRRYIAPQRDVMSHLRTSELPWLEQTHKRRLQESMDRVIRYIEDLDSIRERSQIIKDELATTLADKLNRNMYVLSVVAAIFLPLGFLTGLLGINVGGIPGAENPQAFYIFMAMLAVIVAAQVVLFKKMKWF